MYYVFSRGDQPGRWLADEPFIEDGDFDQGLPIKVAVPDPLEFALQPIVKDAADHSDHLPSYMDLSIPLLRDDLVAALRDCGVNNLDVYNAIIHDPELRTVHRNYKAVNIIGRLAIADMAKSEATVHPGGPVIDVDFDKLVLDEKKARGALMFRLAESTNAILVHQKVKDFLLARGFDDLMFYDPEEVAL